MNKLFEEFSSEYNQLKDAIDRKNMSKPFIKRGLNENVKVHKAVKTGTNVQFKNEQIQTIPDLHNAQLQTEKEAYSVEELSLKLDEYQNLLDKQEIELDELKRYRQSEFKHQVNFQANDSTLKLNQQLLDTQIQLDNSYSKLRTCQDALDKLTVNYNLCVDDYNDIGEEYEKLAVQYGKLHYEYQLMVAKYKNANNENNDLKERLNDTQNKKSMNVLEANGSYDLLQAEKEKNKSLLVQLENSQSMIRRLRDKLSETHQKQDTSSVLPEEPSKFVSIIEQQKSMIDKLGETLKSNQIVLQEIAKNPEDEEFSAVKSTPKYIKSTTHYSPFEYTPNSEDTNKLKDLWFDTKRELASIEVDNVQGILDQLQFHQKELSKLLR
eukprot:NODE_223_length_13915_cov_0.128257.p4 type:complete len:380 gc:universal NODE_223_length_13915_cov_0.128257:10795-9656(-)